MSPAVRPHRVVVVGGGFARLQAVRGLRRAPVDVTLLDRRNFHLFQPLIYQVATVPDVDRTAPATSRPAPVPARSAREAA